MKKSRFVVISAVSGLLASMVVVNSATAASSLTSAQQARVKSLFVAFASADPNKIKSEKMGFHVNSRCCSFLQKKQYHR